MSKEFLDAERALLGKEAKSSDVVISTALIPGKPAPILILEVRYDCRMRAIAGSLFLIFSKNFHPLY